MQKKKVKITKKGEVFAKIKNKLQYPRATLELVRDLGQGRRKNIPDEFIEDALKAIDEIVRLLNKLAGWR